MEKKSINLFWSVYIWLSMLPYFVWDKKYLIVILFFFTLVNTFLFSSKIKIKYVITFFILYIIIFDYFILNNASIEWSLVMSLSICMLIFLPIDNITKIFSIFKTIFIISIIPGMILWLLHLFGVNINIFSIGIISSELINPHKIEEGTNYVIFPGSILLDYMLDYPLLRLQGIYDEPGYLGTVCALILIAEKMNLNNFSNKIIFFAAMMTLSLASYIIILVYIFLNLKKYLSIILIFIGIIYFGYYSLPKEIQTVIDYKIIDRFALDENYNLKGDNRISDSSNYTKWIDSETKNILFGIENYKSDGSSSWKNILIISGIIGMLSTIITYIIIVIKSKPTFNYHHIVFIFLFCLSFIQRPNIINLIYILIFIHAMNYLSFNSKKYNMEN